MCSAQPKTAFTLIELPIVVAIIGILAAIAAPNFQNARIRAKLARVHADLHTLTKACENYRVSQAMLCLCRCPFG